MTIARLSTVLLPVSFSIHEAAHTDDRANDGVREPTAALSRRIGKVAKLRPDSTRKGSSEIYATAVMRKAASSD